MIELLDLAKSFGDFSAVRGLSTRIERGEVYGFLGPNGAGKTTTIRMLMGILVPTRGRAVVDGLDCHSDRVEVKRRVGYLPDSPSFYDFLRGREILEFVGRMHGHSRSDARAAAAGLLEELGLGDATEEYAVNYSAGMKKKLALACALIHDPPVLILDEPTNGLDPRAARDVQDRLRASAAAGKTIFLSTHLLDMAEKLCTRVGIIHRGDLVAEGTLPELKEKLAAGGSLEEVFLLVTRPEEERDEGGRAKPQDAPGPPGAARGAPGPHVGSQDAPGPPGAAQDARGPGVASPDGGGPVAAPHDAAGPGVAR